MLTEEEKVGLSDEEIAAIDDDVDEADTDKGADDDKGTDDKGDIDKKEPEKTAEAETSQAAEIKDSDGLTGSEETLDYNRPFVPVFKEALQADIDKLKADFEQAQKDLDDGEIDEDAFEEAKDTYKEAKWKAEFAQEANQDIAASKWKWEQERFLDDHEIYRTNRTLNAALTATVNGIIATEESQKMTDREVLMKAKEIIDLDLGIIKVAGNEKDKAIKAAQANLADRSKIPPDIGNLPAAEENDDEKNEFAYLDKLEGEKYQKAVEGLSEAQLQRYENS